MDETLVQAWSLGKSVAFRIFRAFVSGALAGMAGTVAFSGSLPDVAGYVRVLTIAALTGGLMGLDKWWRESAKPQTQKSN